MPDSPVEWSAAMERELLLMRHAKSSWSDPGLADFDRPLKGRGRRDATRMGEWLRRAQRIPDTILSSSAERARATVKRLCRGLGTAAIETVWRRDLYLGGWGTYLDRVREVPEGIERLLVVGHNPDLDDLVGRLAERAVPMGADGKCMTTAAVARFGVGCPWSQLQPGTLPLLELKRPKWL